MESLSCHLQYASFDSTASVAACCETAQSYKDVKRNEVALGNFLVKNLRDKQIRDAAKLSETSVVSLNANMDLLLTSVRELR